MTALTKTESLRQAFIPLRKPLVEIYAAMDDAYRLVADQLGFVCRGCEENCCRSRFYHHTYVEYFFLQEGVSQLDPVIRLTVERAAAKARREDPVEKNGISNRPMCPLNLEGRCGVYPHRPMICRLHGIPHKLQRPGQGPLCGPGCESFERGCRSDNDRRLDRTPHYRQLAELERKLRQAAGAGPKIKMTIAEMIISFAA